MGNDQIIIAFTKKGSLLAKKLSTHLKSTLRIPRRYLAEAEKQMGFNGSVTDQIQSAFAECSTLVLVMATGIAVRGIAPVLGNKQSDPAVLVIDEDGRFVISLLPGHLGNANQLAAAIAKYLKATPVITTALEVNELPSLEKLAQGYQLTVERPDLLPKFTGAILNDEPMVVWDHWGIDVAWPENVRLVKDELPQLSPEENMMVIIGHRELESFNATLSILPLRPKCLMVGIDIGEGISGARIIGAIRRYFREHYWSLRSIRSIHTFEQEPSNPGIDEACKELGIPLITFTKEQLPAAVPATKKKGVQMDADKMMDKCEAAAIFGIQNGKLIGSKQNLGQIKVAVAIDLERS
ncbi:MAG TPA: hypothetical protein DDW50_00780 [Firmicutes bacterium]|jgi:cobalamin biosynthesis protein CbiG|nr:hypothetical protein [Bacillota bacterium]